MPQHLKSAIAAGLILATAVLAGCTLEVPVRSREVVERPAGTKEIPLVIGLYFSPEFLAQEVVFVESGAPPRYTFRFLFGQGSAELLDEVFSSAFEAVEFVEARAPFIFENSKVAGVVEPRITKVDFGNPPSPSRSVEITYLFRLLDHQGDQVLSWSIVGHGVGAGNPYQYAVVKETSQGLSADWAIQDAGERLAEALYSNPDILQWLDAQGVKIAELRD